MKISIAILFIIMIACDISNKKKQEAYSNPPKQILEEINQTNKKPNSIRYFLTQFSNAIEKKDTIELFKHISRPLEVYGNEDRDPRLAINKQTEILKALEICLNNDSYDVKSETFFKNSLHLKKSLTNENVNNPKSDTTFSVTNFDFKLINGEWKLTRLYIDTRNFQNSH